MTYSLKFLTSSPSFSLRWRSSSSCFSLMESKNIISSSSRARNWFARLWLDWAASTAWVRIPSFVFSSHSSCFATYRVCLRGRSTCKRQKKMYPVSGEFLCVISKPTAEVSTAGKKAEGGYTHFCKRSTVVDFFLLLWRRFLAEPDGVAR